MPEPSEPSCPLPLSRHETIQLAHGGGGTLMRDLLERVILPPFGHALAEQAHDSAVLEAGEGRLAFTTDSYVVRPVFFPGGDIGRLAVYGTVNDLAMAGAEPLALGAGLILEEGFPLESLHRVVESMSAAAGSVPVPLVTGDTKVVDRGKGDGVYINTSGIGRIRHGLRIHPDAVEPGDAVLVSGDLGRHGIAVMAQREGLAFETSVESDCASLWPLVRALLEGGVHPHCLRDMTRGGMAAAVIEIARHSGCDIDLEGPAVPVCEAVRGACEILGLDPLYAANEGRMLVIVPAAEADRALDLLRAYPEGRAAAAVGRVTGKADGLVTVTRELGTPRILDLPSGEQLPRIC